MIKPPAPIIGGMNIPEMEAAGGPVMEWVESGRARLTVELYELTAKIEAP